jgi:excisionase family DNA binding protein
MHNLPYPSDPTPVAIAAKKLGVHLSTLTRWIKAGEVPAWRVGPTGFGRKRRLFVSMSQLLARACEPVSVRKRDTVRPRCG